MDNEAFLKQLLEIFQVEAAEHLEALSSGLLELERGGETMDSAILETVFREAHSLKGAARSVGRTDIERICQGIEDVFAALRDGRLRASASLFDTLQHALEVVGDLLQTEEAVSSEELSPILEKLQRWLSEEIAQAPSEEASTSSERSARSQSKPPTSDAPSQPAETSPAFPASARKEEVLSQAQEESIPRAASRASATSPTTVRIATDRLDALLLQVEEMLIAKLATRRHRQQVTELMDQLQVWRKEQKRMAEGIQGLRRALQTLPKERNTRIECEQMLAFVESAESRLDEVIEQVSALAETLRRDEYTIGRMVDALLEDVKEALMFPFSTMMSGLPQMVRNLARELGKSAELHLRGGEVEVDKRILEEIRDPILHLLRNSVDHGIEPPEIRKQLGKPETGNIVLEVSEVIGNRVEVHIFDDGAGIDLEGLKRAAVQRGLLTSEEADALSEEQTYALMFRSQISTSEQITDVSGRGLGMAIVQEKVSKLGGHIVVKSKRGQGTHFHILLPLTLATFRGILVEAGGQRFVVPTTSVDRVMRVSHEQIETVEDQPTILVDGRPLPLVRLDRVLGLPESAPGDAPIPELVPILLLSAAGKRLAFRVDAVLGEQEILVKPLGPQLKRVRNISGATVLSSGQIVPVLNCADLIRSALQAPTLPSDFSRKGAPGRPKSILVVEDSLTSRMLLKNILEAAGYCVRTTVDGIEALARLRSEPFDLVVSDVQMPRMDGFELTETIRADEKLASLPVVLVTSLDSKEHRERGIKAGANAYIVKSRFDQSNLLEIIQRFI